MRFSLQFTKSNFTSAEKGVVIMINVTEIINFDRTQDELEELLLFSVATAGKDAKNTANAIGKFLRRNQRVKESPFQCIERILGTRGPKALATRLQRAGVGCFNQRARSFRDIIVKGIDPKTCSLEQLEEVIGIGHKTARAFLSWSRKDANYAILDVHVLRWMNSAHGIDVPKNTPKGKRYYDLEDKFLDLVPDNMTPAEFDFEIWKKASGND